LVRRREGAEVKGDLLHKVEALARAGARIDVATVGADGTPHVATAARLTRRGEGHVDVVAWFCPTTTTNLSTNSHIAVVVRAPADGQGYQLLGRVERISEEAMLDGYVPHLEADPPIAQACRELRVTVERVLEFASTHHADRELGRIQAETG
jgi:hypothetical protein